MTTPERTRNDTLRNALVDFLGEARVGEDAHLDGVLVASVRSVSDVEGVLAVARQMRIPVRPRAAGLDSLNLTAPPSGGILLDLRGMNRILEVNHSERYALIEPGVTWRQLYKRLAEEGGDLALPTAATPRGLSVWASTFLDGSADASLVQGALPEKVWGVEAILSSGEAVRTGSGAMSSGWWGRGPLPDLSGLFIGWQGATGIVTRLSVSLRPRLKHVRRLLFPASSRRAAIAAAIRLAREGLCDEAAVLPWTLLRRVFSVEGALVRQPGEPEAYLHVDWSAETLPELEYKRLRLGQNLVRAARRGGSFDEPVDLVALAGLTPALKRLRDLPLRLPLGGAGLEAAAAVACYGPISRLVDGADVLDEAAAAHGVGAAVVIRPMRGAHHGMLHAVLGGYQTGEPEAVHGATARALERLMGLGFVPHRFPTELSRLVFSHLHPGTQRLALRLRRLLDPQGVLDPVPWGLPAPL